MRDQDSKPDAAPSLWDSSARFTAADPRQKSVAELAGEAEVAEARLVAGEDGVDDIAGEVSDDGEAGEARDGDAGEVSDGQVLEAGTTGEAFAQPDVVQRGGRSVRTGAVAGVELDHAALRDAALAIVAGLLAPELRDWPTPKMLALVNHLPPAAIEQVHLTLAKIVHDTQGARVLSLSSEVVVSSFHRAVGAREDAEVDSSPTQVLNLPAGNEFRFRRVNDTFTPA